MSHGGDLYAKVVRRQPTADGFQTSLQFINIDTLAHLQVKRYVDAVLWGR